MCCAQDTLRRNVRIFIRKKYLIRQDNFWFPYVALIPIADPTIGGRDIVVELDECLRAHDLGKDWVDAVELDIECQKIALELRDVFPDYKISSILIKTWFRKLDPRNGIKFKHERKLVLRSLEIFSNLKQHETNLTKDRNWKIDSCVEKNIRSVQLHQAFHLSCKPQTLLSVVVEMHYLCLIDRCSHFARAMDSLGHMEFLIGTAKTLQPFWVNFFLPLRKRGLMLLWAQTMSFINKLLSWNSSFLKVE